MKVESSRVVLAGLRGGSGKTTLSLGLTRALVARGIAVAPFKKGPDYIDAGWLGRAAGVVCRNLDPYLMSEEVVLESFARGTGGAGIAVVEGNRGVFDGVDVEGTYSTAELAKVLGAPLILVVDCTKSTRTMGALVLGCTMFDREVRWGGVVLNQVAGSRQETLVRRVVEDRTGLPVLGSLGRQDTFVLERHMGLTTHLEAANIEDALDGMGRLVGSAVDIDRVLAVGRSASPLEVGLSPEVGEEAFRSCRIGVVSDTAFQFYYPENLESLARLGAELVTIDALSGPEIPGDIHALYIGGGFPEAQTELLQENTRFRRSLLSAAQDGLPIYAECGGLMLLGRSIETSQGRFEMAGVLPVDFRMGARPVAHGYTVVEVVGNNWLYDEGFVFRGHEFHYSSPIRVEAERDDFVFKLKRGHGITDGLDGLKRWNVIATYTHVHALGTPQWATGLVRAAVARRV